jgi:hypothetical protein
MKSTHEKKKKKAKARSSRLDDSNHIITFKDGEEQKIKRGKK